VPVLCAQSHRRCQLANQQLSFACSPCKSALQFGSHVDQEIFAMKLITRSYTGLSAIALIAALGLGGCAGMTAQEKSTATGAVIGGVAGNVLCGGVLCTGAGAAVGGVIGHELKK
jgi:osmotically inducible lipoprotein OsmB